MFLRLRLIEFRTWHTEDLRDYYFVPEVILGSKVFSLHQRRPEKVYRQAKSLTPAGLAIPSYKITYGSRGDFAAFQNRFCPDEVQPEPRDRKEVPGYNTNNVNEKYAMGYSALANSFGISSLVIESERDELQRNHWQMHNARLNKTLASVITSACEKFFRDITDIHTIKPKHG
ncbi:unnamed protein product [Bathycoccus prasinos]